jgi:hypothetical protein
MRLMVARCTRKVGEAQADEFAEKRLPILQALQVA